MTGLKKQAKILTDAQVRAALNHVRGSRYPMRDRLILLFSVRAGMRAKEIANVSWAMVTDAQGEMVPAISLVNSASKGKSSGRIIPMHADLLSALTEHRATMEIAPPANARIIFSERREQGMNPAGLHMWFHRLYTELGFTGASSHSGRRTFITKAAIKITQAGGSLRDVQELAGHASISMTQNYIQGTEEAKRKVIAMM